jgi:periplasmic divalent cation tolerance protein
MKKATQAVIVLVTAPSLKVARGLAQAALTEHLVACANLVAGVESHYWWRGKMESSRETLIIFKTTRRRLAPLQKLILKKHPYDTPEFVVLTITSGSRRYLDWLEKSTA